MKALKILTTSSVAVAIVAAAAFAARREERGQLGVTLKVGDNVGVRVALGGNSGGGLLGVFRKDEPRRPVAPAPVRPAPVYRQPVRRELVVVRPAPVAPSPAARLEWTLYNAGRLDVREEAAFQLANLLGPAAVPALARAAKFDPAPRVRVAAIAAMERIGDPRALPTLGDIASLDQSPPVRRAAIEAAYSIERRNPRSGWTSRAPVAPRGAPANCRR